jgi:hypothetical protein
MLASYYNDAINWSFSSKTKNQNIADSKDGDVIVHVDGDTITSDIPLMVQNMSLFLQGMKLRFNNRNGT